MYLKFIQRTVQVYASTLINRSAMSNETGEILSVSKISITKILDFVSMEILGIYCTPKCVDCQCKKCLLRKNKCSIKEER